MLALDEMTGFGRARARRRVLARTPGCDLELHYWYGGNAVRPMLGVRSQTAPGRDLIEEALDEAASLGITTIYTEAVPENMVPAFLDAGFTVIDELVLLSRPVGLFTAAPRPRAPVVPVTIVSADPAGYDELAAIDARAFPDFWSLSSQGLTEAVRATKSAYTFVAEFDGSALGGDLGRRVAVGYAIVGLDARTAYLQRLAVDPAFARRGIGAGLAAAAIRRARRSLASVMWVNTPVRNPAAISLYESLGFARSRGRLLVLMREPTTNPTPDDAR